MTILVGTNESPEAAAAMAWAAEIATTRRCSMIVAEAFERQEAEMTPDHAAKLRQERSRQLATWVHGHGQHEAVPVATEGGAVSVLAEQAHRSEADMVVIGSKPYEGVTRRGLGSLAHALVHHLRVPLVVVPAVVPRLVGGRLVVLDDGSEGSRAAVTWSKSLALSAGAGVVAQSSIDNDGAEALLAVAEDLDAGLLVIPARDHRNLNGYLLGAVPGALLHHPTRPIAILPYAFQESLRTSPVRTDTT